MVRAMTNSFSIGRSTVLFLGFLIGILVARTGVFAQILTYWDDIVYLAQQHMILVASSGGAAILVGLPVGIWLSRPSSERYAEAVMQVFNIGTTIPTLAVIALSMTLLGIGFPPAFFGLFVASLLPIVRNTYAGLLAVPAHLKEAAMGMGMTKRQILLRVELPNALYVIFSGIRTSLAINVGTTPLAFLIGGGGLGELIFTGIDLMDTSMLLAGAIPTAMLAVFVDFLMGQAQLRLLGGDGHPLPRLRADHVVLAYGALPIHGRDLRQPLRGHALPGDLLHHPGRRVWVCARPARAGHARIAARREVGHPALGHVHPGVDHPRGAPLLGLGRDQARCS